MQKNPQKNPTTTQCVSLFNLNSAWMYLKVPFPMGLLSAESKKVLNVLCFTTAERPVSGMPLTSACTYLHCAWNPDGDELDVSTKSVGSGNLYSQPEIVVYEAPPHLITTNSPPDSRATFWSTSLCRKSIQHTRLHMNVYALHNTTCTAINIGFPVLMWIDQ